MPDAIKPHEVFTETLWENLTSDMDIPPKLKRLALHVVRGLEDKQIAREMKLAVSTVRYHLVRLCESLHVDDRAGVMIFFLCRVRDLYGNHEGTMIELPPDSAIPKSAHGRKT